MKKLLHALPLPIAAVMLGLAALGNLLQSYSEGARLVLGALAALIWLALLAKLLFCRSGVGQGLRDPVVASVAGGAFPMATMLLAAYAKPFVGPVVSGVCWYAGVVLHMTVILWFTVKFAMKRELSEVFASYYIVYVGIMAASLTAPAFDAAATVGDWAFRFGFAVLLVLLVVVTWRYVKLPVKSEPAKPLFCIYAAPVSLCLAGYIQVMTPKSAAMVMGMLAVSGLLYVIVLIRLPGYLKLPFYPSCAAFTFPFVITAIAARQSAVYLTNLGYRASWLSAVVLIETVIAAMLVLYTLACYVVAVAKACRAPA